jgi:hypothetical protein
MTKRWKVSGCLLLFVAGALMGSYWLCRERSRAEVEAELTKRFEAGLDGTIISVGCAYEGAAGGGPLAVPTGFLDCGYRSKNGQRKDLHVQSVFAAQMLIFDRHAQPPLYWSTGSGKPLNGIDLYQMKMQVDEITGHQPFQRAD